MRLIGWRPSGRRGIFERTSSMIAAAIALLRV